jgi:hypothetical protein
MMEHPCPLYIQKLSLLTEALNSIRSFVRKCGWSLQKQILSAASKERHRAGDLLGVMLMSSTASCSSIEP